MRLSHIYAFHNIEGITGMSNTENPKQETFKKEIVSDNRITIPPTPFKILGLKVGEVVEVTIRKLGA
jgi:hypothetical protein